LHAVAAVKIMNAYMQHLIEARHGASSLYSTPICRHPFGLVRCVPPGQSAVRVQSRDYLLLLGMEPQQFHRAYPGRKYFFDLGTSKFPDSLAWFISEYGARGVQFDDIWVRELYRTASYRSAPLQSTFENCLFNVGLKTPDPIWRCSLPLGDSLEGLEQCVRACVRACVWGGGGGVGGLEELDGMYVAG
jgi:hypothetical protein